MKAEIALPEDALAYYRSRAMGQTLDRPYDLDAPMVRGYRRLTSLPAGLGRRGRVLDLACGLGAGSFFLAPGSASVIGVDLSHAAIRFAVKHYGKSASFVCASALTLPFGPVFDAAVVVDVLEHFADEETHRILGEIRRVLKPGGVLLLHAPTGKSASARVLKVLRRHRTLDYTGDRTHRVTFSVRDLVRLLEGCGFSIQSVMPALYAPGVPGRVWKSLATPRTLTGTTLHNQLTIAVDIAATVSASAASTIATT